MTRQDHRSGITAIEIIVAFACIGILGALLLAGIQKVRSAADRVKCANNLHQIGLGLIQYHDTFGSFPPAVAHPAALAFLHGPATDPFPLLNWEARLLPYVEQDGAWSLVEQAFDTDKRKPGIQAQLVSKFPLGIYRCPADSRDAAPGFPAATGPGMSWYLGIAGKNSFANEGLLYLDSRIRLQDITDGASNTLLLGERPPNPDMRIGRWYGGWGVWGTGDSYLGVRETHVGVDPSIIGANCPKGPYHFRADRVDNPCAIWHFWSLHPGGAHFLAGDGSTHFLSYSADQVLPALATRSGREVVAWPE